MKNLCEAVKNEMELPGKIKELTAGSRFSIDDIGKSAASSISDEAELQTNTRILLFVIAVFLTIIMVNTVKKPMWIFLRNDCLRNWESSRTGRKSDITSCWMNCFDSRKRRRKWQS